ncbi:hypothetical protein NDR87_31415 [Nocardia sp. CDC159]|uniref:Minor tail protein n=1 Tax=Nocardia pulmonis TaxID=2951408 RepID=A0A9X2J2E2_9NOCA|nr:MULTISPECIES: hypothetical protein [Nocardia]MCM6777941.1 hypothetical protein [Nocardia pulmonis]MCM6790888.1 hypothetical protein [Nocardia sp. CDC159]
MKLEAAAVAVHSIVDGSTLGVLECPTQLTWSRELNEVSRCRVEAPIQELSEIVTPWLHWVSCWHGQALQWIGPVVSVTRDRAAMTVDARDVSVLMWHTRTQITRQWSQLNVAEIAADMWRDMLTFHAIDADPVVLPALASHGRYDVAVQADMKLVQQDMAQLSKLGLRWTVVRGRPILGTQPTDLAAELADCDFTAAATISRSGAKTANDVRVQGKNGAHTERVPLGGLHLQSIVSLDDLFGVSNIRRATQDYVARSATIRDELVIPQTATLTPDAPVELDMLVPGINLAVSALGLRTILRLDQVQMTGSPSGMEVAVTLSTPDNRTELEQAGEQ